MGIGQVISSFVFSFFDLGSELKGEIFKPMLRFVVTFQDVEGTPYRNEYVVDFAQYEGISELGGGDPLHLISEELKKVRGVFEKISRSDDRLGVNVFDAEDRGMERQQLEELIESHRRAAGANG
jgi:hypothetical protein